MNRLLRYLLTLMAIGLTAGVTDVRAQVVLERYVNQANKAAVGHDGTTWAKAYENLQEGINALRAEMQAQGISQGIVYVAEGKYNPTESTERQNSNILNTSFLMYEGITIYGGYAGTETGDALKPENRVLEDNQANLAKEAGGVDAWDNPVVNPWNFKYKTILSGNHSNIETSFTFDESRGQYRTSFPSSSYHVVWFGTNGEIDSETVKGHRRALTAPAGIDGCIIEEGYAASKDQTSHNHMGYGGGAYLVPGAFLRNCIVRRCQATLRGGGIYMDGGGSVEHCLVSTCQVTGIGISQGYGGAVCIDYDGSVRYSYLAQSTARIGAGLAICHTPNEYPFDAVSPYMPYATSCIVANNTSNAEGGGIYLDEGGTLNHCTVVKNNCIGKDITYYGRRHGRTGGVYVRNCGMLYNSVFWGNKCAANSDIQLASIQQTGAATTGVDVYHCALYNQDITDWSNIRKEEVFTLSEENRPHRAQSFCTWFEMNKDLLGDDWTGSLNNDLKAGVDFNDNTKAPEYPQVVTTWRPQHSSDLAMKGVQVTQNVHVNSEWIRHAHTEVDLLGREHELVSTLGAIAHKDESNRHALVAQQGAEGRADATPIPTMFVNTQRDNETLSTDHFYGPFGDSWEHSVMVVADAVNYFEEHRVKSGENKDKYKFDGDATYYPAVQILLMEGTYSTAGKGNYFGSDVPDIRTAAIRPKSNMRFYGGYPAGLTGTSTSGRNPRDYVSLISSNIVGEYENNSVHAFGLINVHDVIIDGVRMANGNAIGLDEDGIVQKGTGLIISNTTVDQSERVDMTGNILRNSVVANTQAYDGAAFYVNALMPKGDGTTTRAELTVQNTVIRNCTSLQDEDMKLVDEQPGVIVANGNARITLDHCTIANNEGYPLKTTQAAGHEGEIVITNSALFANSATQVDDRTQITTYAATYGTSGQITGHHNLIDKDAAQETALTSDASQQNRYILDTNNSSTNYPTFVNPSLNVGHSEGVDRPIYGGTVSYEPLNKNPMVNAADEASMAKYDRTDINHFDYGGAADIGAIENTNLPKKGTVIYVTPDGAGKRDGSSWGNAIAGNTIYALNGAGAAGTDALDDANGTTRIINTTGDGTATIGASNDNGVLTTDSRYQGGFAFYNNVTETVTLTQHSTYHITETTNYTGGFKNGTTESDTRTENVNIDNEDQPAVRVTDERAANPSYPYGELSGASRTFWRANPCVTDGYNKSTFPKAVDDNGWINNTREENYVSGLQYAVEKASAYNVLAKDDPERISGIDSIQVWVSNGKYTDYKGFVMRDKTTVMGSFPAVKDGQTLTPGLGERQALMSAVITIPKSKLAENYASADYETILQISDTNPKKTETSFNTDAILFHDADFSQSITTTTNITEDLNRDITHNWTWDTTEEDWTDKYLQYPGFRGSDGKTIIKNSPTIASSDEDNNYYTFGSATSEKDCWHMSIPKTSAVKKGELYKEGAFTILPGSTKTESSVWIWPHDAELTDISIWQTMKNVIVGSYQLEVDLGGGYRGTSSAWGSNIDSSKDTNIHFYVVDAQGNNVVDHTIVNTGARERVRHHTFSFNQNVKGNLTVKIYVGAGNQLNPSNIADGTSSPNRREVWMSNLKLTKVGAYTEATTTTTTENTPTVRTSSSTASELVESATYTSLRKRVLTMPDVTVPTYGGGRAVFDWGDDVSHTDRVPAGSVRDLRTAATLAKRSDPHYVGYSNIIWDGFTIRHGFIYDEYMAHGGGAGVNMYEGVNLRNCIVYNNISACGGVKGGGIFCDGATSTVEGCFVLNNTSAQGTTKTQNQIFAGGMFMYEGTCFNSLFAKNYSEGSAGGVGFCVGRFYNNTIAYNTCNLTEYSKKQGGGISVATASNPNLFIANTIIYGNNGVAIRERGNDIKMKDINPFIHCYIQSEVAFSQDYYLKNIGNHSDDATCYGVGNILVNGVAPSAENTPFNADLDNVGNYTGNARTNDDFRLHTSNDITCVNYGTEEFTAKLEEALGYKKAAGDYTADIKTSYLYKNVEKVVLPLNDVAFADRVQDCAIDIGAYEYDGAIDIKPDEVTFADQNLAVYYVTQNGVATGDASSDSPANAACGSKFQKIIDAAGRYKYAHPDKVVVVALGGNDKDGEGNMSTFAYKPSRSIKGVDDKEGVLDYSLIVPHGVQLWGGFYSGTGTTTGFYKIDGETGKAVMLRDPLRWPTYLSGDVVSPTGATGQAHHVVTFTNDLFDLQERKQAGQETSGLMETLTNEKDRAVLDGLFITGGYANGAPTADGTVTTDMNGAAAIVTSYAHIRNCVVTGNQAAGYGGGLYLKPNALVSGCIIKNNTARMGGGIFVEQPSVVNSTTHAHLLTTTVVGNTATSTGGGLVFESNLRANSCLFWHNSANDKNNVSGNQVQKSGESSSIATVDYPLLYCGIEVTRWEGVNNLLLSANEGEGVRWDHREYYETYNGAAANASLYYPIEMSSALARAGMTYDNWRSFKATYPTLEDTDIAGFKRLENTTAETVSYDDDGDGVDETAYIRKKKDNALIEMGARVVNASYAVGIDVDHIMTRLYVVHTEDLDSEVARKLQDNEEDAAGLTDEQRTLVEMYKQMGSCFANPFHRLGDALEYIIDVRSSNADVEVDGQATTLGEYYKDKRFEIFLTNGTFYPYRNAYGRQAASRSNTFVIPEKVSLIGGVDHLKHYGQAGYGEGEADADDNVEIPIYQDGSLQETFTLSTMKTTTIRKDRDQSDLNMNNVVEPWELSSQSILSGNVVSGTTSTNAYHVVTCYPDAEKVGSLPTMYSDASCETTTTDRKAESSESLARRTIFIDGVTVTGGMANDISDEDAEVVYQQQTYFRGGGILVDGNWDHVDELNNYVPDVIGVANRNIPLLVTNCMFHDNMAGNGGAIYSNGTLTVTGCHFVQNYSRGPNTALDQRFIPWTAGGAIATNYDCTVVNTIFANNEAQRGKLPITIKGSDQGGSGVEMADIRQGFGGVISSSETSTVHALNCNFVRNKAVAFPAIYNFVDQRQKQEKVDGEYKWERGDWHHWAVNCIFWGNEKNEDVSAGGQVNSYAGHTGNDAEARTLGSLFTVADGKTARKRDDIANFGIDDRSLEVCFFCAYEQEHGLSSKLIVNPEDVHLHKKLAITNWNDFNQGTFMDDATYPASWKIGAEKYTHNQYLDAVNDALNGPSFIQPSTKSGIDGYMQNADWLVSRLNRLIDTGWSYLPQHVTITPQVDVPLDNGDTAKMDVFNTVFMHEHDTYNENGKYTGTADDLSDNTTLTGTGIYNFFSLQMDRLYSRMGMADLAPFGEHAHMKYERYGEHTGMNNNMRRISTYPKIGEQEVYIDIGVYEYQYVQLFTPGNECDVIWVRPDNPSDGIIADGSTWAKATNNVQQALDMLMSSHNDHDKILKVRAGDYSPVYLTHGKLSYYIEDTDDPNAVLYPTGLLVTDNFGVNSITIRGGYPNDASYMIPDNDTDGDEHYDGENVRNPELHPARFIMSGTTGYEDRPEVKENLFVIQKIERQEASKNFIDNSEIKKWGTAVPVAFEGLTFSNPYADKDPSLSTNLYGASILYTEQHKEGSTALLDPPSTWRLNNEGNRESLDIDGRPKLLIKDCVFLDNSNINEVGDSHTAPAVHILSGGGDAVIANTVFHSNGGNPLEAVNTKVVNCTFALNKNGQVTLTNNAGDTHATGSVMHNSLIWKDELHDGKPYNFGDASILGQDDDLNPWLRDMHPRPSDRIMSKASEAMYKSIVPFYSETKDAEEKSMSVNGERREATVQRFTRTLIDTSALDDDEWSDLKDTEQDLGWMPRFRGKGLERGPFEVVAAVQRVLYVNPQALPSANNDGARWTRAFSEGRLQDAIDAAGVYSATNGGQRAYVFVRGDGASMNDAIRVRDGVTVYGSVASMLDSVVEWKMVDHDYVFKAKDIYNYTHRVRADRAGVASTNITSLVGGITADGGALATGFVMDGFHITNPDTELDETPVVLTDDKTLLRNCLIYNNKVSGDKPVVNISRGLLYNSLLYGNTVDDGSPVVKVAAGATGGVLNCTVVAESASQTAIDTETDDKVVNTVTYNEAAHTVSTTGSGTLAHCNTAAGMFAPYLHNGANRYDCPVSNYGGHQYPHVGSVAYIGQDATLRAKAGQFMAEKALMPGYLLVKDGGSLYGQGNTIRLPYVATERQFAADQQYALFSLPYDWKQTDVVSVKTASGDALTQTLATAIDGVQRYDGAQRAQWDYEYRTEDSPCWVDADEQLANNGRLLTMNTSRLATETPLRFTSWGVDGEGLATAIYSEDGTAKTVTLTQYDNMPIDGKAHFTTDLNMGWNLKGMPWLVSSYKTGGTDPDYKMDVPHLFYDVDKTTGSFTTQQSWTAEAAMGVGDAYLMQTAVIGAEETLTFKLPVYTPPAAPARPYVAICSRSGATADVVAVQPQADAEAAISYHEGTDGVKWMAFDPTLPQIYVATPSGMRMSLMAAAPTGVDIPLGVVIPEGGDYTIMLPTPEAFADHDAVWLIDNETGAQTDLKSGSYKLTATGSGISEHRLMLRFGNRQEGQKKDDEYRDLRTLVKVRAIAGRLPLSNWGADEPIEIYAVGGTKVFSGTVAESRQYPFADGIYIIRR